MNLVRHMKKIMIPAVLALALMPGLLSADNTEANEKFALGLELFKAGDFEGAAGKFKDAQILADDQLLKCRALQEAQKSYKAAGLRYKEFEILERLIKGYPTHIDFAASVEREYILGNEYFQGYRDPVYTWIPIFKVTDKTMEIYEAALRNGPYSKHAPDARLRLGRLYLDNGKNDEGIKALRETIKMYPETKAARYAMLELGSALTQLAEKGDGDGAYAKEATEVLNQFLEKYPKAPEAGWVKETIVKIHDIKAERLNKLATFYYKKENDDAAQRYLTEAIKDYPEADTTTKSEELLSKIDTTYEVKENQTPPQRDFISYGKPKSLPKVDMPIVISPENSNGKWLLPIRDLKIERKDDKAAASSSAEQTTSPEKQEDK